jgi:threonyl-tRNA synthetase
MNEHDHRRLGPSLNLFHQQEEAPGCVFWHPRGVTLYRLIEEHIRGAMRAGGFREVRTPQLVARSLWERSGHWAKFGNHMFSFVDGERSYALKPMSCPGHIELFRRTVQSYRELPVRFAEFGACHRYEPAGALHGLMRGRAFTQDDAHVFCLPEHVEGEVARFCELLQRVYARFGFRKFQVGFSTRPALRDGSDALWDQAEALLLDAGRRAGFEPRVQPGEGAFYGPKLEFILEDREGREWQCGTIQLDLVLPEKLDARVVDAAGAFVRPLMIHHAVLGSIERFIAVLLEHHRGRLPFWLAPEQVAVAPVSGAQEPYARKVAADFERAGLRCDVYASNDTLSRRLVAAREMGIPVFGIVGQREEDAGTVVLREGNGQQQARPISQATAWLVEQRGS